MLRFLSPEWWEEENKKEAALQAEVEKERRTVFVDLQMHAILLQTTGEQLGKTVMQYEQTADANEYRQIRTLIQSIEHYTYKMLDYSEIMPKPGLMQLELPKTEEVSE